MLEQKENHHKFVPKILEKIHSAEDINELIKYKNILVLTFISSIGEVASIISLIVFYKNNILDIILIIPILTIAISIILYIIQRKKWNEKISMLYEELIQQNEELIQYNKQIEKDRKNLRYMANYDDLTGLPNRKMFMDKLTLISKAYKKNKSEFAVVFIDIDNFKEINDTMGHYIGDLCLCEVSKRLIRLINKNDVLARLGGDEFALIVHKYQDKKTLLNYIENLRKSFEKSFLIEKCELRLSASFGISIFPQDAEDVIELIRLADKALYVVKEQGKNGIQFFSND